MTEKLPKIISLTPIVLPDKRRVTMELMVDNLPSTFANVTLSMPDTFDTAPTKPIKSDPDTPSPYPNVELTILNSQQQEVATLFIIEYKEPFTSLTMHLRVPDGSEQYLARAEITHQDKTLDMFETLFTLN